MSGLCNNLSVMLLQLEMKRMYYVHWDTSKCLGRGFAEPARMVLDNTVDLREPNKKFVALFVLGSNPKSKLPEIHALS